MPDAEILGAEEILLKEKEGRLVQIIENIVGNSGRDRLIRPSPGYLALQHHSPEARGKGCPISLSVESNTIFVFFPFYMEEAERIKQDYERFFPGEEFEIETLY